jgi:XRN 5'-3' exonuclease N-terminus
VDALNSISPCSNAMGIAGFSKWLLGSFPECAVVVPSRSSDSYCHVMFDMNQLCHQAARRAHNLETFAKLLFREIDATLRNCVPTKSIYFAFDGPAPVAKLLTQRRRRAKDASKKPTLIPREAKAVAAAAARAAAAAGPHLAAAAVLDVADSETEAANATSTGKRRKKPSSAPSPSVPALAIDRVALTPGTALMNQIVAAVEYYCYVRLQSNARFAHLQIRINGCQCAGEGEVKIYDFLNTHVAGSSKHIPATDSAVVVGSDADIVLQALACTKLQNIFVFIRNSHQGKGNGNGSGAKVDHASRTNTIVSVWQVASHLHRLFPEDSLAVRVDFIVIAIMNGNDYLKALRGCNMPRFWRRYLKLRRGSSTDPFARKPIPPAAAMAKLAATNSPAAAARLADDYDEIEDDCEAQRRNAPFSKETLINPASRTFNWPFLCALVSNLGALVPEVTDASVRESVVQAQRNREQQALARRKEAHEAMELDSNSDDDIAGDDVLYTGNEQGDLVNSSDDDYVNLTAESCLSSDSDGDFDEYDDTDSAHIDTLIAISGSSSKYFDCAQWLRALLFTVQMYIDAYCPDFYFCPSNPLRSIVFVATFSFLCRRAPLSDTLSLFCAAYTKQYAPSPKALVSYIKNQDGDPHPAIQAPVSVVPALTPMKAGFAMLPLYASHHLPKPLQDIVHDRVTSLKIFLQNDLVDFDELNAAFDRIPESSFTLAERERSTPGRVLMLRNPTQHEYNSQLPVGNPHIPSPGKRYPPILPQPVVIRRIVNSTSEPPCYAWPSGVIRDMLHRPFKRAHSRGGGRGAGGGWTARRGRGGHSSQSGPGIHSSYVGAGGRGGRGQGAVEVPSGARRGSSGDAVGSSSVPGRGGYMRRLATDGRGRSSGAPLLPPPAANSK